MSYKITIPNPLAKNLKSNNNASKLNGGYICPKFAITCHTNQLYNNDIYLFDIFSLIKLAIANAGYVNHIQLPNPKNKSDVNIIAGVSRNANL